MKVFLNPIRSLATFALAFSTHLIISSGVKAQSLTITNTISNTVGTTAIVTGSGSYNNTNTWSTGTVGVFEINNGAYFMRVNASSPTGPLAPGSDSLMVARTIDSQGLMDTGTLSVYIAPNPSSIDRWSLDMNFSFFSDSALLNPATISNMMLTSLDIDFNQRYYTHNTSFPNHYTASNTALSTAVAVSGYTGFTSAGDSTFNNPRNAVASVGTGNSFDIKVSHDAVALFMFEFRNPSQVTGLVPEPSSAALLLLGGVSIAFTRRRKVA